VARIYRDAYGIPHVRAESILDLARGQGLVTARDRAWQLEYQRRRATGTASAVLGERFVAWDVLARRTRIGDTARRAYDALEGTAQDFIVAFVEGLNRGLAEDVARRAPELVALGIEPEPWEPWTPLAAFHGQHLLFASLADKLWQHRVRAALGPDAGLLARDGGLSSGSNAWAVGGRRTDSGLPLIGGDPHRVIESPGVYMQVRLACEDPEDRFDVAGFTFPGVPGVQHFAHAGHVAWAITNACADYQDVFDEPLSQATDRRTERIEIRDREPMEVEVWATPRGLLFEIDHETGRGLSLRDASTVLGDLGFNTLLGLLRARSVADVDVALDGWVAPGNNVVIADREGQVRFRNAGRVPRHPEANRRGIVRVSDVGADPDGGWDGWVDLPNYPVAADGQVVTANERRGQESAEIGNTFAPAHRANRIDALLAGRDDLTPADFEAIHNDTYCAGAKAPIALIATLEPGPAGREVQELITGWDLRMDAHSAGAAAFAAWRTALTRRLVAEPVLADLVDAEGHGPVFAPYLDLRAHVGLAVETILSVERPFGLDVRRLATLALDDAAGHPAIWGETHVLDPTHAFDLADLGDGEGHALAGPMVPEVPVSGDIDTVRCAGSLPAITDRCFRGSVARYVWDLSDAGTSGWVVPMGASGDPASPHHVDQLEAWTDGRLLPIITDWQLLTLQ
jgi:penicillin amidase